MSIPIQSVHCLFEQSGTFKNAFISLGIPAYDYDIKNDYGQTDYVVDLFLNIDNAYDGKPSIFDDIKPDDLIFAFFPCIYFTNFNRLLLKWSAQQYSSLPLRDINLKIFQRYDSINKFSQLFVKLLSFCKERSLRIVIENPYSGSILPTISPILPSYIDLDRSLSGDVFKKPTMYFTINYDLKNLSTFSPCSTVRQITRCKSSDVAGICSAERSMITPEYARNFICDHILGIYSNNIQQQSLF